MMLLGLIEFVDDTLLARIRLLEEFEPSVVYCPLKPEEISRKQPKSKDLITCEVSPGKRIATQVRRLDATSERALIEKAVHHTDSMIWKQAILPYLQAVPLPEGILFLEEFQKGHADKIDASFVRALDGKYTLQSWSLRQVLPVDERMKLLLSACRSTPSLTGNFEEEIQITLNQLSPQQREVVERDLSVVFLPGTAIWSQISPVLRLERLAEQPGLATDQHMTDICISLPEDQRPDMLLKHVKLILQFPATLQYLSPQQQVETAWSELLSRSELWSFLSWQAKLFCIYRYLKEKETVPPLVFAQNDHPAVEMIKLLLHAKEKASKTEKQTLFLQAHQTLEDFIVVEAYSSPDPLDLKPLLPECYYEYITRVPYCEGRVWSEKGKEHLPVTLAYCPRLRNGCSTPQRDDHVYSGARFYAEPERDWSEWSILEVLDAVGIVPSIEGLRSIEYATKVSGSINRLNEIRSRLRCSVCDATMVANVRYAKLLAKFNTTIFSCREPGHDHNIYFNECWFCGGTSIIDSREAPIRVEGYYLCLTCGSGPQESVTYTQGDRCPKCGSENMRHRRSKEFYCVDCNHSITIPHLGKCTGPRRNRVDLIYARNNEP